MTKLRKKTRAWILRERDYYDAETPTVGVTTDKELAEYWDSLDMCFTDEMELDDPSIMKDYRVYEGKFEKWKAERKKKK